MPIDCLLTLTRLPQSLACESTPLEFDDMVDAGLPGDAPAPDMSGACAFFQAQARQHTNAHIRSLQRRWMIGR